MDSDEKRQCPQCSAIAESERWDEFGAGLEFPNCPNGHGEITEEGLLRKVISKPDGSKTYGIFGKAGVVICPGDAPEPIAALLETISHMETAAPNDAKLLDFFEVSAQRWNRKRAKRLFYRWLRERNNDLPSIKDASLRDLADRLIGDAQERVDTSAGWSFHDDFSRWGQSNFFQKLKDYEIRRDIEPVLLVPDEIQAETHRILSEAIEAYRWGLSRSVFAVCRAVLEDAVRRAVLSRGLRDGAIPIREESLEILLNCLPDRVLSRSDREAAHRVRKAGNEALHSSDPSFKEEPWEILSMTMGLLQRLLQNR